MANGFLNFNPQLDFGLLAPSMENQVLGMNPTPPILAQQAPTPSANQGFMGKFDSFLERPGMVQALANMGAAIGSAQRQGAGFGEALGLGVAGFQAGLSDAKKAQAAEALARNEAMRQQMQDAMKIREFERDEAEFQRKQEDAPLRSELLRAQASQATEEARLFKEQANEIAANDPNLPAAVQGLSAEGQKEFQKLAGKNAAEKFNSFGSQINKIPQLVEVVDDLRTAAGSATFTLAGKTRDSVLKQFGITTKGALSRADFTSTVDNVVLPLLKDTFGAAFTVEEGNRLRATLGDPDATPEEKMTVLDNFIGQKLRNVESLGNEIGMPIPQGVRSQVESFIGQPQQPVQGFSPDAIEAELRRRGL